MSTPKLAEQAPPDWKGTVISRTLKAWMAGYEMSHSEFAHGIQMNPRTFERRLKTGKFDVEEVRACAHYMSKISRDRVPIGDLFAGRLSVFGPLDPDDAQVTKLDKRLGSGQLLLPYLTEAKGISDKSPRVMGHLRLVS